MMKRYMNRFRDIKVLLPVAVLLLALGYATYTNCYPQLPRLPPKYKAAVMAALERSGENRNELMKALAGVRPAELPAMCDMISRMPNYDLANITSNMLLDHIDCVFEVDQRVPWKLKTDSRLFLDYVLPYRTACESLENSRRDIVKMTFPQISGCQTTKEAVTKVVAFLDGIVTDHALASAYPYRLSPS